MRFEISHDVRRLVEFLQERDKASYDEMNRRIGRFVNGRDRYVLTSALKVIQREQGKVFVTERMVGVRLATNVQIASLGTDTVISKTGRIVRRGQRLHPLVNPQDLTGEERDAFWIGKAQVQMLSASLARRNRSKIANEIREQGEELDVKDVVALFSRPIRKKD